MRRAAGVLVIAQFAIVGFSSAAAIATDTRMPALNIVAGVASGAVWIGVAGWWLTLAVTRRSFGRLE